MGSGLLGLKSFFQRQSSCHFEWWDHQPISGNKKRPLEMQEMVVDGKGSDFYIEVYFRHHNGIIQGPDRYANLQQAEFEGRLVSKKTIRPGLVEWRIRESGDSNSGVWYVATEHVSNHPNAAVLWCSERHPKDNGCTTAEILEPGIAWDMRLKAKHSMDWPDILTETIRVIQLLHKA